MDFWQDKCFKCIVAAWLVAIAALSVNGEVKERKYPTTQYQDTTTQR